MAPPPSSRPLQPLQTQSSLFLLVLVLILSAAAISAEGATWCVVRSDASEQALQRALDYACGAGADCTPIQSDGLCYLPNTLQAHAAYAFDSFYQRKAMAPGSCDFAGTATVAATDPSYGSCVYPSSFSTAGGTTGTTPTTNPSTPTTVIPNVPTTPIITPPIGYGGSVGGVPYAGAAPAAMLPSKSALLYSATMAAHICFIWVIL